jgi:hypothetical protein
MLLCNLMGALLCGTEPVMLDKAPRGANLSLYKIVAINPLNLLECSFSAIHSYHTNVQSKMRTNLQRRKRVVKAKIKFLETKLASHPRVLSAYPVQEVCLAIGLLQKLNIELSEYNRLIASAHHSTGAGQKAKARRATCSIVF